jgi:transposase
LSKQQAVRYEVVQDFLAGKITRAQAAERLAVSTRTLTRLARKIQERGLVAVIHGNKGKASPKKIDFRTRVRAQRLVAEHYFDCNVTHARELLAERDGLLVSRTTLRRWLVDAGLVKRKRPRRRKARRLRERMAEEGLLLQLDGSPHKWNGVSEWTLISAIDDATSEVPHARFYPAETTLAVMDFMGRLIAKKGLPRALYVDRAGWAGGRRENVDLTQFERAMTELGIAVIHASSPQAKGRVERGFDTYQDRLPPELRLAGAKTIEAGNDYLEKRFLPDYWNARLTVEPRSAGSSYQPLPAGVDLRETLCVKVERKVKADHTISLDGKTLAVGRSASPEKTASIAERTIEVRLYPDGEARAFYAGEILPLTPVRQPPRRGAA